MTDAQILSRARYWQKILKLDHWNIRIKVKPRAKVYGQNDGSCEADYKYLTADVEYSRDLGDRNKVSKKDMDEALIHEMLHCPLSGMKAIPGTPEDVCEEQAIQIFSRVIRDGYTK